MESTISSLIMTTESNRIDDETKDVNSETEFDSAPESVGEMFFASLKIVIGLVGMIGNFVVCLVVIRLKFQRVHVLITTQAVDDFMCALALLLLTFTDLFPMATPSGPTLGYLYCFFWQSHMWLFFVFAVSTFNLVAVSVERYIAVLHPIWYSQNFSSKRAMAAAALAWALGPMMQVMFAIITTDGVRDGTCSYYYYYPSMPNLISAIGVLLFFWEFFIPCIIMGSCFTQIAWKLRQQTKRVGTSEVSTVSTMTNSTGGSVNNTRAGETNQDKSATSSKRNRNVTITLIIVFVVYATCWSVDHFLFLQYNLGGTIDFNGSFYGFAVSMAMLNSACNPFIYALRYNQYRKELYVMLTGCKRG